MKKRNKIVAFMTSVTLILCLIPYGIKQTPKSKAADYGISNPRIEKDGTVTWDCVYFGNYWQNDTNGDGIADKNDDKEPIKWRVLSVNGNDAFLLADKGLDVQPYDDDKNTKIEWENCSIRNWLNSKFYGNAFNTPEQNGIILTDVYDRGVVTNDKIYLLSYDDILNPYFGFNSNYESESKTREMIPSRFALDCGAYTFNNNGIWWFRLLPNGNLFRFFAVATNGSIWECYVDHYSLNDSKTIIRPCLHLDLSSNTWRKADAVTATGGTFATPTPVPTDTPAPTIKPTATPSQTSVPTKISTYTPLPIRRPTLHPTVTPIPKIIPTPTPTLKTVTVPTKPIKVSAKNSKKKTVMLSWKKIKGATGYQIQYVANTAFAKKTVKVTNKTKITIKNLKKKKTYSFRVRAYKISNGIKVYGNWSAVKKVKIKK